MSTLTVPLNAELEKHVESLVQSGYGANKADVVRKAIQMVAEDQAVQAILKASTEPALSGDLRELAKKIV
jgi:Arc/MetJ-type ribon-helix-helix transcriptional regulator